MPIDNPEGFVNTCLNDDVYGVYVSEAAIYFPQVLLVAADNEGIWPEVLGAGGPGAACFHPVALSPQPPDDTLAYRIACP